MPRSVLVDTSRESWVDRVELNSPDGGLAWSVEKRRLRGGRREGVEQIVVRNGPLELEVIPTRGMSLRGGRYKGDRLGWDSPVSDGPVHPALVNLAGLGGFGWLEGFDELLVRCGLEHNGPPVEEKPFAHTLHGRIGNLPAHRVEVEYPEGEEGVITVVGEVLETRLFGPRLSMETRLELRTGSNRFRVIDRFTNLADSPARLAILYHWNWGRPYLGEGSRFLAPVRVVCPQTARAVEGIERFEVYGPPQPGFAEQVYLFELAAGGDGRTLAMLRNEAGDKAIGLRYRPDQLPCFTLWKNEGGEREGYVTGLEPASNYPNPRPFEQERGRYIGLGPGESHTVEMEVEVVDEKGAVEGLEGEVEALRAGLEPRVYSRPSEPFAPPL